MIDVMMAVAEAAKSGVPWGWVPGMGALGAAGTLLAFLVKARLRPRGRLEFGDIPEPDQSNRVCSRHDALLQKVDAVEVRMEAIHVLVATTDAKLGLLLQLKGIDPRVISVPLDAIAIKKPEVPCPTDSK
jgi:hypothetical protein